jgi:hypothetical protein
MLQVQKCCSTWVACAGADDEDGAHKRLKRLEASEQAQEAAQTAGGATRATIAKARPSEVLKRRSRAIVVGMAGQTPPVAAELDTVAAGEVCSLPHASVIRHDHRELLRVQSGLVNPKLLHF